MSPLKKWIITATEPYLEAARAWLEGRRYAKAWRLAEALEISPQRAGQILSRLEEWEIYDTNVRRRRRVWYRPDLVTGEGCFLPVERRAER